ncbi:S-adenosyl-L-methionine-dependent methyltransferase [Zopfochytrium polystomum]|nr:S-adenosyl-L-methionine-dependent methyltransferase [Zopfochytrium polystomum]
MDTAATATATPQQPPKAAETATATTTTTPATAPVAALVAELPAVWEEKWSAGRTGWDLGAPTPGFASVLASHGHLFFPDLTGGGVDDDDDDKDDAPQAPYTALVPGCGRAYDVAHLAYAAYAAAPAAAQGRRRARRGLAVLGVDVAPTAVVAARGVLEAASAAAAGNSSRNRGDRTATVAVADFFAGSPSALVRLALGGGVGGGEAENAEKLQEEEMGDTGGGFDLVYDHTFLCALRPALRAAWAARVAALVRRGGGHLVAYMFPLVDDGAEAAVGDEGDGPPYKLSEGEYERLLSPHFERVLERDVAAHEQPPRAENAMDREKHGRSRIAVWVRK